MFWKREPKEVLTEYQVEALVQKAIRDSVLRTMLGILSKKIDLKDSDGTDYFIAHDCLQDMMNYSVINLLGPAVDRHVREESFLDSIIQRIRNKQLPGV